LVYNGVGVLVAKQGGMKFPDVTRRKRALAPDEIEHALQRFKMILDHASNKDSVFVRRTVRDERRVDAFFNSI
jgi:hypothetical protein